MTSVIVSLALIALAVIIVLFFYLRSKRKENIDIDQVMTESFYADLEEPGFVFPGASSKTIGASVSARPDRTIQMPAMVNSDEIAEDEDADYEADEELPKLAASGAQVVNPVDTKKVELTHINVLKDDLADNREIFVQTINDLFDKRVQEFVDYDRKVSDLLVGEIKDFSENYIDFLMGDAARKMDELQRKFVVKLNTADDASLKRIKAIQSEVADELELLSKSQNKFIKNSVKEISSQVKLSMKKIDQLNSELDDLKTILDNVKSTSINNAKSSNALTTGEVNLQNVLARVIPEHYRKNVKLGFEDNVADFAIVLAGKSKDEKDILMPIDTKFKSAVYTKIEQAQTARDEQALKALRQGLIEELKSYVADISSEFLNPEISTYYGVLYIKQADMYNEILHEPQIFETIKKKYHVILLGPATVESFFISFNLGLETLQVEKVSRNISAVLDNILSKTIELDGTVKGTIDFHDKIEETLLTQSEVSQRKNKTAVRKKSTAKERLLKQISEDDDE